jgi:hypothetical protein
MKDISKLPKWAQDEITSLTDRVEVLKGKLEYVTGLSDTNTFIMDGINKIPLPKNSVIDFRIGDNQQNKVSVYIRKEGVIDINTDARDGSMVIMPRAANSFYIDFKK